MPNGKVPKDIRRKAMQLRREQQKIAGLVKQKDKLDKKLTETKNSLKAVKGSREDEDVHRVVGSVMIEKDKKDLINDLQDDIDNLDIKVKSMEKKIKNLRNGIQEKKKKLNEEVKDSGLR